MNKKQIFSALRLEKAIEKKEYTVELYKECDCSYVWYINERNTFVCDTSANDCGIWAILVVDGKNIVDLGLDDFKNWDLDVNLDWPEMEEDWRQNDLEDSIYDILQDHLPEENLGCGLTEKDSLIKFLEENKKEGYKLYICWPRNFDNEYTCILAEPGAKPPEINDEYNESYEEVSPERWADRYLEKGDDATDYSIGFELIESNNFYLKNYLKSKGLTNKKLAETAGVSIKTVESWFADPTSNSYKHMRDITLKGVLSAFKDVDQ